MGAERTASPELERLSAFGSPGGPGLDEALTLFAHLRSTSDERRAIDGLLARHGRAPLPDPLLVAVASALVDRGNEGAAARALETVVSSPGLMMRAEILVEAGDLASGIALVERVLFRDIDWPGARERHARWLAASRPSSPSGSQPAASTQPAQETSRVFASVDPHEPYERLREVGRGGAAAVYEARDRELGRRVALKAYHRPERDRAQLLHEARVAVALAGPGIVQVFDVDPLHGWIVLEWAHLGALRALLRSRQRTAAQPIARWAVPLARALAHIHGAGWVHHDVKPANVLLAGPDAPLLGDFGSARRIGEPSPPGSLGYVSPERLAGRASDPRDDVYGYGRVLEAALDALRDPDDPHWRALAAACTGPDDLRPIDGRTLLARAAGDRRTQSG